MSQVFRILAIISLLSSPLCLSAQNAEDYFHGGAKSYIWGKDKEAETQIFTGLRLYPKDPLLNGMAGLLKKQEQKQQQQQNQQQQKDQQKGDQQNKDQQQAQQNQQKQSDEKKDSSQQQAQQQKQDEQKQQAAQQSQEQKEKQQQAQQSAQQPKDKGDDKEQEAAAAAQAEGQMTPQQARQLLDAQKGDEQMLPPQSIGKPVDRSRPIKDW
jgi:hypothetical protein